MKLWSLVQISFLLLCGHVKIYIYIYIYMILLNIFSAVFISLSNIIKNEDYIIIIVSIQVPRLV
jgi:hypothetical protein